MTDKDKIKEEIERLYNLLPVMDGDNVSINYAETICTALEKYIDSIPEESASEDLDFLVISLEETIGTSPHSREVIKEHLQKAAEWQKQQMKEALQTEYEKGRFDMKEEMIKDAVDGEVAYQIGSSVLAPTDIRYKVVSDRVYIPNVKLGDKVKIIICKPEQQ